MRHSNSRDRKQVRSGQRWDQARDPSRHGGAYRGSDEYRGASNDFAGSRDWEQDDAPYYSSAYRAQERPASRTDRDYYGDDYTSPGDEQRYHSEGRDLSGSANRADSFDYASKPSAGAYGSSRDWGSERSANAPFGVSKNYGALNYGAGYGSYGSEFVDDNQRFDGRERHDSRSEGGAMGLIHRAGEWAQEKLEQFTGKGPKGYKRSDERIHEDVCETLSRHSGVDASDIEVKVKDGEVTLSGTVLSRQMKRTAEDAIDRLSGVKEVSNQLRVGNTTSPTTQASSSRSVRKLQ